MLRKAFVVCLMALAGSNFGEIGFETLTGAWIYALSPSYKAPLSPSGCSAGLFCLEWLRRRRGAA